MTKVSAPTFVVCGLGDPKVSLVQARVADGLPVNIPVLGEDRLTWGVTVLDNFSVAVNATSKRLSSRGRQIRHGVYLRRNGLLNLRARELEPLQHPGKASQEELHQIVPITDTGGLVE
jgi:hypothetical protein